MIHTTPTIMIRAFDCLQDPVYWKWYLRFQLSLLLYIVWNYSIPWVCMILKSLLSYVLGFVSLTLTMHKLFVSVWKQSKWIITCSHSICLDGQCANISQLWAVSTRLRAYASSRWKSCNNIWISHRSFVMCSIVV